MKPLNMKSPRWAPGTEIYPAIYDHVKIGIIEDIIYVTPDMSLILYGVIWNDGTYTREADWRLSDHKQVF